MVLKSNSIKHVILCDAPSLKEVIVEGIVFFDSITLTSFEEKTVRRGGKCIDDWMTEFATLLWEVLDLKRKYESLAKQQKRCNTSNFIQ